MDMLASFKKLFSKKRIHNSENSEVKLKLKKSLIDRLDEIELESNLQRMLKKSNKEIKKLN